MISGARNCTLLQYFTSCTILLSQLFRSTSLRVSSSSSSSSSSSKSSRTMRLSKLQPPALLSAADFFFFFFSRILFWRADRRGYLYLKVEQNERALEREYAFIDRWVRYLIYKIHFILFYFLMCAWFEIGRMKNVIETVAVQETRFCVSDYWTLQFQ